MNTQKAINAENMTISFSPELEEMLGRLMQEKATTTQKVAAPIIDQEYKEHEHYNHNPTDPIRSLDDIERLKNYFLNRKGWVKNNIRDYAYFVFSLNMCRRAGDILALHVYDILNPDGSFKTHVTFEHEQKTGKKSVVFLNTKAKNALVLYFNSLGQYKMSAWPLPNGKNPTESMSVQGMRKMLQRAAKALNIDMHMGTHSLRKTNPYHMISTSTDTQDEVMVSQFLQHNDIKTTYHYIKRSQTEMDNFIENHGL